MPTASPVARTPTASSAAAVFVTASGSRAQTAMSQPSAANVQAIARPLFRTVLQLLHPAARYS